MEHEGHGEELSSMTSLAELNARFGSEWFEPDLFHRDRRALRFELAVGEGIVNKHLSAYSRAACVLASAFEGSGDLLAVLWFHHGETPLSASTVKRLSKDCRSLGLPLAERFSDLDVAGQRLMVTVRLRPEEVMRAVWGAVARELGVRPRIAADVHVLSVERGIVSHIYDDRGMDVSGPNVEVLRGLFTRHRDLLLSHDLAEMIARYS